MSNKIIQLFVAIAVVVGLVTIATWGSRELYYFFSNLLYWMRYNIGQLAVGVFLVTVLGYLVAKK